MEAKIMTYLLAAITDFTGATLLFTGLIALVGALTASIGITRETKKMGTLFLPNLAAFSYLGFSTDIMVILPAILMFAFCATDGMPFGKVLNIVGGRTETITNNIESAMKGMVENTRASTRNAHANVGIARNIGYFAGELATKGAVKPAKAIVELPEKAAKRVHKTAKGIVDAPEDFAKGFVGGGRKAVKEK